MNQNLARLQRDLPAGCDAALVTSQANRFYYTGINSSAGMLLVTRREAIFLVDFRYIELSQSLADGFVAVELENVSTQLPTYVKNLRIKKLFVETDMTVADYHSYQRMLGQDLVVADAALSELMASHRSRKSFAEYEKMQKAQDIADKSYLELLNFIKAGRTEREIATQLAYLIRKNGATQESFETIAISGMNTSLPHGKPTDKVLMEGELFTLDFGVVHEGYVSDMTRTLAIGQISDKMREVYNTVLTAQQKALDSIAVGVSLKSVDAAARDYIAACGYGGTFGHGLGHSLGIDVHESPRFSPKAEGDVCVGLVMSVEPGIYLPGQFGCRIEDVVYITADKIYNLTRSDKQLMVV